MIVKLSSKSAGQPAREPLLSEEEQKRLMYEDYKCREELAKLSKESDNSYLNSAWADQSALKRRMHGVDNISWRP